MHEIIYIAIASLGGIVAVICGHSAAGWKAQALNTAGDRDYYKVQLKTARELHGMALDKIKTLEASEEMLSEARQAIERLKANAGGLINEIARLKAELAKVAADRFLEVAKRSKSEAELARQNDANAHLTHENDRLNAQLTAIKAAIAVQPEPELE